MSKKVAPRVQFNFEPDVIEEPETINNDLLIDNSDVVNEDYDSIQVVEMPEVIEKEQIVEDNIFESIKSKVNKDVEISEIDEPSVPEVKPQPVVKKVQSPRPAPVSDKKPPKKKRVLSQEHKAKLALAREKALATRRAKAEEKKRMKQIENETKQLRKKKAEKDLEDLKSNVNNEKPQTNLPTTTNAVSAPSFTKQDLENAQLSAIIQYETIRKARKEEKKKEKMIQEQKEQMKRQIARYGAKDTNGRLLNRWDACY